ncbi:NAD-dependent 4,6-dehydratase LegB [Methylocaldum szegediense]|jgi:NAD dependent epimerase/dehydratase|uniref:UDP-glucose 4-epimerase n=1 Tax=Methylocaldum szegediense TaxID=73780 RepID=A0ABN8XDY7_9GAMM|nr:NAD-dependent 4,6-dehydratase LegB [Methylocaldum szegediense]CAI8952586.1 UDP-glucose 4-epimerase [Methylocaldum szegediense]
MTEQTVLVTGGDGFIGSHLVEQLVSRGYRVRALAQYNSFNSWGWLEDISCLSAVDVVTGDIRDPHFCRQLLRGVDSVFHLAALIAIPYSYRAPDSYIDTNVKGTLNICQAALEAGVKRVIHTSTSEVYGTAQYVPIDEKHPLQPQSPYSASKIAADQIALSFYHAFGLPVTVARPFNTYGPRQSARAVIPTIISQIAHGYRRIKLGDVTPTRDFNYVDDTCRGFLAIADAEDVNGETINIGSNTEISISETFALINELMGGGAELVHDEQRERPSRSEVFRLRCDNRKLHALTGFKPQVDLREGLRRTIAWFTDPSHLKAYKPDIYNI